MPSLEPPPEETVLLALDALLKVDVDDSPAQALAGLSQYSFDQLVDYLEAHRRAFGQDRLARLEWAYLGARLRPRRAALPSPLSGRSILAGNSPGQGLAQAARGEGTPLDELA